MGKYLLKLLGILFFTSLSIHANPIPNDAEYLKIFNTLQNLYENNFSMCEVNSLQLVKEDAVYFLQSGVLYHTKIGNSIHVLVFEGKAKFTYSPWNRIEREHLARCTEQDTFRIETENMFFLFADSTFKIIERSCAFHPATNANQIKKAINGALNYMTLKDEQYVNPDMMHVLLEDRPCTYFYSHVFNGSSPVFYLINPFCDANENVQFKRGTGGGFIMGSRNVELINQYAGKSIKPDFPYDAPLQISQYNINQRFDEDLDVKSDARFSFMTVDAMKYVCFYLHYELEIDSIVWENGKSASWFRGKENPYVWIKSPDAAFNPEVVYTPTVYYHGELTSKTPFGWVEVHNLNAWYPRVFSKAKSTFNVKYEYPEYYTLVSCGIQKSVEKKNKIVTSVWRTPQAVKDISFALGRYEEFSFADSAFKAAKVFYYKTGHNEIAQYYMKAGILSGRDVEQLVARDVVNSMNFYRMLYGKIPFQENISAAELPYSFGQAFPGLIHLSWGTFQGSWDKTHNSIFRAHEAAHQWWGIAVGFKSYHDQWLSEAFAEYSSLMFYQSVFKDNENFMNILDEWKKDILNNRKYLLGEGQKAGPISLGYRNEMEETAGDYQTIVYEKGAWVLHMLRNILLEFSTMSDDKYNRMIKEFYTKYYGGNPSTDNFIALVEKYCGRKMDWFFDQWVYGTSIPKYTYGYSSEQTADGKYTLKIRVKQDEVPDKFTMPVPILIELNNGTKSVIRLTVDKPVSEISIPSLPAKLDKITFNLLNSVLCTVDDDDYDDIK